MGFSLSSAPRLLLALIIPLITLSVHAFSPSPAPLWWLNTFLKDQTIGRFENSTGSGYVGLGPCPTGNFGFRCAINFTALPPEIKAIGVTIDAGAFSGTYTIGSLLTEGAVWISFVELNDIELNNVIIAGNSNATFQNMSVLVDGFKGNVRLKIEFAEAKIAGFSIPNSVSIHAATNKAGQSVGTDVALQVYFNAPTGKTLANSFPDRVSLGPCNIDLDLSLSVQIFPGIVPFAFTVNDISNLLIGIAEPLIGDAVCGVIRQLFTTTAGGTQGIIPKYVNQTFTAIGNLSSRPDPVIATEEASLVATLTQEQQDNAIHFADNRIVEGASKVLNNWLGQGNPTNPLLNEVVNLLTMPDNGTATFTNLTRFGLSIPILTPVALITVDVLNATIIGLNTFGSPYGIELIKNNYDNPLPSLNYTLDNKISLDNLNISFVADVKIERNLGYSGDDIEGGWIHNRPPLGVAETSFRLNYNLGLKDIDIKLALALALNPGELGQVQVGQLLGKSGVNSSTAIGQLLSAGKCTGSSVYGFRLPFLEITLGELLTPVFAMNPVDTGIVQLVNDVTGIVLNVIESPLTNDLNKISQHWVRPLVNELVTDFFTAVPVDPFDEEAESDCPVYTSKGKISPNFLTSAIFSQVKQLIRDVVGGDPVKSNTVSINELLQQVLIFACEAFGSPATCTSPAAGEWSLTPPLSFFPGKSFPTSAPFASKISITGLDIEGVNSVARLLLDNVPASPQGISFLLELGTVANPLEIVLKNHWMVNYAAPFAKSDVDELFDLSIVLHGLKINATITPDFDLNQLYLLKVDDLFHSACVLAPFVSLDVDLDISLANITILLSTTPGPNSVAGNELRSALAVVLAEQGPGHPNLKNMVDFVLKSVGKYIGSASSSVSNAVTNATNCRDKLNLFDTFVTRIISGALSANLTDVFSRATGAQPPVPPAATLDSQVSLPLGADPFDLSASFFVPLINDAVAGITQADLKELLQTLGNGTGDVFSDSFSTEADGSVSLDVNFLQYAMFQDGFDLSFLIENATFYLYSVKLTNLTQLDMSSIELVHPLSKFVTKTHLSIPGKMTLFISLGVKLPQAFKGVTGPDVLKVVNYTMDLVDLDVSLQALTGLDGRKLNGLSLGHFVSVDANQTFSLNTNPPPPRPPRRPLPPGAQDQPVLDRAANHYRLELRLHLRGNAHHRPDHASHLGRLLRSGPCRPHPGRSASPHQQLPVCAHSRQPWNLRGPVPTQPPRQRPHSQLPKERHR